MPLFLFFNTQTMHFKSILHNSIAMTPYKTFTLVGFEPRSSVPEATAPRRRGINSLHVWKQK
jgi:hypothetical protein